MRIDKTITYIQISVFIGMISLNREVNWKLRLVIDLHGKTEFLES